MPPLRDTEVRALHEAVDDESRAWATYNRVIADFGEARSFIKIREAETRHIESLRGVFSRYGLAVPENRWPGRVTRSPNLQEACEAGAVAVIENDALYERLLASTQRPDILAVFRNLQEASRERHLPAFQRCAGRGGGARRRRDRRNCP